jgi:uncharacterized membrane protein YqjE
MNFKQSISDFLKLDELKDNFVKLIEANFELKVLETQEKAVETLSVFAIKVLLGLVLFIVFMVVNLLLINIVNHTFDSYWLGYVLFIGLYGLLLAVLVFSKEAIKQKIKNKINEGLQ